MKFPESRLFYVVLNYTVGDPVVSAAVAPHKSPEALAAWFEKRKTQAIRFSCLRLSNTHIVTLECVSLFHVTFEDYEKSALNIMPEHMFLHTAEERAEFFGLTTPAPRTGTFLSGNRFFVAEEDMTAYKKARWDGCISPTAILVLTVPKGTTFFLGGDSPFSKCRAEKAIVERFETLKNKAKPRYSVAVSIHDSFFHYRVGETVTPREPFSRIEGACASGIHFFLSRQAAEQY